MTPIQQLMLGSGGASEKTYMEDVFSTYLYTGNTSSSQTLNNGVDLSGEGGMVWIKNRDTSYGHQLFDTVRGVNKRLRGDIDHDEDTQANTVTAFNSNGFTVGTSGEVSDNNSEHASWTFRKAPGFFTVKSYSGTNGTLTMTHDLGCIPGLIIVKRTDTDADWQVYHRSVGSGKRLRLNLDNEQQNSNAFSAAPTATHFTVDVTAGNEANQSGGTFIAYLFAGGASTAATARSVDFDGSSQWLSLDGSTDLAFGTGDFTVEMWINPDNVNSSTLEILLGTGGNTSTTFFLHYDIDQLSVGTGAAFILNCPTSFSKGQWYHVAVCRSGGVLKIFKDGVELGSTSDSTNYTSETPVQIARAPGGQYFNGQLSNLRVVKGTAVYTSSFKPPTEPLTNITNTKLLCCNNSSTTGSTVTPGTITANGSPTASTDSPFDDPAAFNFGDSKEGIIKTGSYVGNGLSNGPEIDLGWEPQWWMVKRTDDAANWQQLDSMRGWVTSASAANTGKDWYLAINNNLGESDYGFGHPTPTGFKLDNSHSAQNADGANYVYIAIRRSDGYVGKPVELGTDVFAMDTGGSSSTIPNFDSGFPVDMALRRRPGTSEDWRTSTRLTQHRRIFTNTSEAEGGDGGMYFDSNVGWEKDGTNSTYQSWMWKRHAGFDVVCDLGSGSNKQISHSLSQTPEMIFRKSRDSTKGWLVYHKDLPSSGSALGYLSMSDSLAGTSSDYWNQAPTATHFTVGSDNEINIANEEFINLLFSSVSKISAVGSYTGNGNALGSSPVEITTEFAPRFILIKRVDDFGNWRVFDTLRGINIASLGGANDSQIILNSNAIADTSSNWIDVTSTSFKVNNFVDVGSSGASYIYYCHA